MLALPDIFHRVLALAVFLTLVGCQEKASDEELLASKIAANVKLPQGARSLGEYSRYYAHGPQGIIDTVYIIHSANYQKRVRAACAEARTSEYPCDQSDYGVANPGNSKWLKDPMNLPAQSGGGCSYIHIRYDSQADRVLSLECNGPY